VRIEPMPARQLARDAAPGAGKVYLVGAAGRSDLLTVKALRLLESAQVVLHDDLVAPAILALAKQAELVNVASVVGEAHYPGRDSHRMIGLRGRAGAWCGSRAAIRCCLDARLRRCRLWPRRACPVRWFGGFGAFAAAAAAGCH